MHIAELALDLRAAPLMRGVGDGPERAAREWRRLELRAQLAPFDPVVVSSLARGLGTERSDLDVVCDLRHPAFVEQARAAYGARRGFRYWISGNRRVVAFQGHELWVELVGEAAPIEAQRAYRHAIAHRRLVELGGDQFAAEVRDVRRNGLKTEPALAAVLGLQGDPYDEVERLASAPDDELRALLTR